MDRSKHLKPSEIMKMPTEHRKRYLEFRKKRFEVQCQKHNINPEIEVIFGYMWDTMDYLMSNPKVYPDER